VPALKARQSRKIDDMSILPKVGLEDVPSSFAWKQNGKLSGDLPIPFILRQRMVWGIPAHWL